MNEISAKDWELLGLFEREPDRQGLDPVWLFDDSLYRAGDGCVELTCAIHPYHKDVRIILWESGAEIYEYSAMGVDDIAVSANVLNIYVSETDAISITIRPKIRIKHERKTET